jgi:hypothetical protein
MHRIGPGPVLQYRPSRFQTAPASSDHAPRDSAPSRRYSDCTVPTAPARLRCRRRVSLLLPRAQHGTGHIAFACHAPELTSLLNPTIGASPHSCRRIHRRSSALRDAAPQADHRVACRAINRCHRPLLRPITDGSPLPELPRVPPHAPLPPAHSVLPSPAGRQRTRRRRARPPSRTVYLRRLPLTGEASSCLAHAPLITVLLGQSYRRQSATFPLSKRC